MRKHSFAGEGQAWPSGTRQGISPQRFFPLKVLHLQSPRGLRVRSRQAGLTLIDLMIATTIMVIAVLATVGTIQTTSALGESTRETTVAYQAARSMVEDLQSQPFENLFRRHNEDADDDPAFGVLPNPGPDFAVDGMDVQAGDADGAAGRLIFPVDDDGILREDFDDPTFGLPMDLNGDGIIDGDNRIDDHIRLPVHVRVEWTGNTGDRFVEFQTVLYRRD